MTVSVYRYSGEGKVNRDGQEVSIPIPPGQVLVAQGAFLQLTVTHPRSVQEKLGEQSKKVPAVTVYALIDTGASFSVVSPKVVEELGLLQTGFQKVTSVNDQQDRPVYFGFFLFPWGTGKEIQVVSCLLQGIDCLVGRDILKHWHFTYNGIDGSIVICD